MQSGGDGKYGRSLLFFLTAIATGLQLFRAMMWGVWGRPSNPLELVAMFGSFLLLWGAAATFDGAIHSGNATAALGCGLLWIVYAPATWSLLLERASNQELELLALAPLGVLIAATLTVIRSILHRRTIASIS